MSNTSLPAISVEKETANHLAAASAVSNWMHEYRRYLLDGDPNILHPKARAALVLSIAALLDAREAAPAKVRIRATPDGKAR